ncbi:MAG: glycosyltransferase family 2 protein [Deferribacteres bacterium]|nr:glycosyltransferase family 2 protein [Deferribacteres bacterium]
MAKVSIVIPALNEGGVVGKTVRSIPKEELRKLGLETEVLVVDNASEDNTAKEAEEAGARVVYEPVRGYGSAYRRGLREATGDIIVMGDADGTYPLERAHEFIQPMLNDGVDFVIGTRLKGDIQDGAMPWLHRYIGNPFLTFVGNLLFKTNISDFHCGMRAFTREALNKMNLHTTGMEFATEMIVEAGRKKLRIEEIPIEYRPRGGGKAKLNSFRDGWRHLRFMLMYSPDYLFMLPGALFFTFGLVLMLMLLGGPVSIGGISLDIHPMVLGSLLTLLGLNILLLGLWAKIFAIEEGFIERDRGVSAFLRYFQLEKGLILGLLIFLAGFVLNFDILYKWYATGFSGPLPTLRIAIFASTLIIMGVQIIFSSWFTGLMGIERHGK